MSSMAALRCALPPTEKAHFSHEDTIERLEPGAAGMLRRQSFRGYHIYAGQHRRMVIMRVPSGYACSAGRPWAA